MLKSDRTRNQFLFTILLTQNLTDQLCILQYLGHRADSYVEEFIFGIMNRMTGKKKEEYEYLLRKLLDSVFHATFEEDELAARILINKKAIDFLVEHLHTFNDPMLKCQIMRLIPYLHEISSIGIYMTEGNYLVSMLEKTDGKPGVLIDQEILCLLDVVKNTGDSDYLDVCQSFVRLSMNKQVVDAARETIRVLLLHKDN